MNDERRAELLVKVVDGVATPAEREALMTAAVADPSLRAELERHQALKAITDGWVARLELDLVQDRHDAEPVTRGLVTLGLVTFIGGLALLAGGGAVALFLDPEAPLWLKLGLGSLGGGTLVLLAAVIRWRLATAPHDAYSEVVR